MNIGDAFRSGLANGRTTALGVGLGGMNYMGSVGFALPHNQETWISFGISLLMALLGILAKDAATGSQPK